MTTIFDATRKHAERAAAPSECVAPVTELQYGDTVRIPGNATKHRVLDVDDLGDGHVKVLWCCDPGDSPPGPFTIFQVHEHLLRS